jgi:hypothetical protein
MYRRIGVSACRRVGMVAGRAIRRCKCDGNVECGASDGSCVPARPGVVRPQNVRKEDRAPRHTHGNAFQTCDAGSPYADTPIRRYADTFPSQFPSPSLPKVS